MKLEVGMYFKSRNLGFISKITSINEWLGNCGYKIKDLTHEHFINKSEILKASFNIIDLIEIGDVIIFKKDNKKYEITNIKVYEDMGICLESKLSLNGNSYIFEFGKNDIKSILTKEQFDSVKYEVKGDR